ncbi:hypothetical protein GF367_03905 [Candidatus Woesearchaeota archaeon]|nr:hypothetical protein [Candidatus Woesearchaeota archaeon]
MSKSQVALEFVLYTILAILLVLVLVGVAVNMTTHVMDAQGAEELEDLAYALQEEFVLAAHVRPGYHRALDVPQNLKRGSYTISNDEDSITLAREGITITLPTPPIDGTLTKGINILRNENETVIIT